MEKRILLKVDHNGTKYWEVTENCPRCGGSGIYLHYGVCYECGGRGTHTFTDKEYTPEHEAELEAKRLKRANISAMVNEEKQRQAVILNMQYCGFTADGVGFIHYGNTYKAKNLLKKNGAKWCADLQAWIAPKRVECDGVMVMEIKAEDICTDCGMIDWDKAYELRERLQA